MNIEANETRRIALWILHLRKSIGLTQQQMAQHFGVSYSTWNRWENGHNKPTRNTLWRLQEMERIYGGEASQQ